MLRNTLVRTFVSMPARASATHVRLCEQSESVWTSKPMVNLGVMHNQVRHLSYIKPSASGWDQLEKFAKDVKNNVKDISMDDQIDKRTTDAVRTLGLINNKLTELDTDSTTATVSFNIGVMQVSFSSTTKLNKKID